MIVEHTEHLVKKKMWIHSDWTIAALRQVRERIANTSESGQSGSICLDPALPAGHEPDQRKGEELSALVECKKLNWAGSSHRF